MKEVPDEPPGDHGLGMELHSEKESFREVLPFRAPKGAPATLLVLRRRRAVWLTFGADERTTVAMNRAETDRLVTALRAAQDVHE